MFRWFIDIFCKDTIVGLSNIEKNRVEKIQNKNSYKNEIRLYKNFYSPLFKTNNGTVKKFKNSFTDPIAYHLLKVVQNQKALYSV